MGKVQPLQGLLHRLVAGEAGPFVVAGGGADSGQLQIGLRLMQPVGGAIHGAIVAATHGQVTGERWLPLPALVWMSLVTLSLKSCIKARPMRATPSALESLFGQEWDAGQLESLNLSASLCVGLRLTPEQFTALCEANPDALLELAADGSQILMTPTGIAGRPSRPSSGVASLPPAPIWWRSWRAPVAQAPATKAPEALPPCARRWRPINATAPALVAR
jgi:hypothetical protein